MLPPALFAVAVLVLIVGCTDRSPTTSTSEPSASRAATDNRPPLQTLDESFAAVADKAPGFAGAYWDSNGTLVIRSTGASSLAALRAALGSEQGRVLPARAREALSAANVVVRDAAYDSRALLEWKRLMYRTVPLTGVVFVDIDEVRNKIHVGTAGQADRALMQSALEAAGMPGDAFTVTSGHVARRQQTLSDDFDPIPGGVRVEVIVDTTGAFVRCTLTANVRVSGDDHFITSSHCTFRFGDGQDGSPGYQNNSTQGGDLIGYEVADPDLLPDGQGDCPDYVVIDSQVNEIDGCRYSDAALFAYETNNLADYGTVARTVGGFGVWRITINSSAPRFLITGASLESFWSVRAST